jgi:hypothetical protein
MAHYVNNLAKNTSLTLQENINSKIETWLNELESVVTMIGNVVQTLKARTSLRCHASFQWYALPPYNDSHWDWECIKHHLQGVWSHIVLSIDLMALHKGILDIQSKQLPIIHPGETANRMLNALQGFNPLNISKQSFWILTGIIIFCSFYSVYSQSSADLECPKSFSSEKSSTMFT